MLPFEKKKSTQTSLTEQEQKKDPDQIKDQSQKFEMTKTNGSLAKARNRHKRQPEDTLNLVKKKKKGSWPCDDEIVRLRNENTENLLKQKKLILVLDLDHTLLNSTKIPDMTAAKEEYLKWQTYPLEDVSSGNLFIAHENRMTKLRPFVRPFLEEANNLFEMWVYSKSRRSYALDMVKLLDPTGKYFDGRVIAREDSPQKHLKDLDVVLGKESVALILDDTREVWRKHEDNLILMEKYHFFASSHKKFGLSSPSLSEEKKDEDQSGGTLATILNILKIVHNIFYHGFKEALEERDVRQVLMTLRKEILKNCKIVFAGNFILGNPSENHYIWKMAERLGATCLKEVDPSVTHVISNDRRTKISRWAKKENKFLVNPQWLKDVNYQWERQPELELCYQRRK